MPASCPTPALPRRAAPCPGPTLRRGRRIICTTAALAALIPASALAMPGGHGGQCGPRATLTVAGEGISTVAPDRARITVGVTTQAPTDAQAMSDNAARQTAVIEALRGQGIEARDIQTSGLNLSPLQDYSQEGKPPTITGYQAQNMVTIRVRDVPKLGQVLDTLVGVGANEVQGIAFEREDQAATQDEARRKAVADAKRRAEVLADAAGLGLGPLVSLSETGNAAPPVPMMAMSRDAKGGFAAPVEAGELTISAQVQASYALDGGAPACALPPGGHGGPGGPGETPEPPAPPQPVNPAEPQPGQPQPDAPMPGQPAPGQPVPAEPLPTQPVEAPAPTQPTDAPQAPAGQVAPTN